MVLLKTTYTCNPHIPIRAEVITYVVVDNNDCGGIWEVFDEWWQLEYY